MSLSSVQEKPFFSVSDEVRFKSACSATETSLKIEILLVASVDMILSNKQNTKVLIRLCGCTGWSAPLLFQRFSYLSEVGARGLLNLGKRRLSHKNWENFMQPKRTRRHFELIKKHNKFAV